MTAGPPRTIGRYTVTRLLGSGGMGEVYLGFSPAGSPVAVKLIRGDRLDPSTRARFEREAVIARTVVGTNRVARFLDADPYAERPWLAMEYVPGRTLKEHVSGDGAVLPVALVASLGALLAEGLAAVHAANLLHRDLKPQNIMLGAEGPMIIDFGLSALLNTSHESLSTSGVIVGTVSCMPPEQTKGTTQLTPAVDVYSLGTVLLYAATGHFPYDGPRWELVAAQVANPATAPNLTGLPTQLKALVGSMLAHEPADRPTVDAVADACAGLLRAARVTPAAARRQLITRTFDPGSVFEEPPLELEPEGGRSSAGGRADDPVGGSDDDSGGVDEQISGGVPAPRTRETPAPPGVTENGPTGPPPGRARRPAARRVAEELRRRYAVGSAL